MLEQDTPLQADLFTGEWIDPRTNEQKRKDQVRQQPQQQLLFPQQQLAQFGVQARPVMPFSPGKLHLISEDPRTEEEVEADLLRQAQSLTHALFPAATSAVVEPSSDVEPVEMPELPTIDAESSNDVDPDEATTEADMDGIAVTPIPSKYEAYLALVAAATERAATGYRSPSTAIAETIAMNRAKLEARLAGLTGAEITAALTIGEFCGRPPTAAISTVPDPVPPTAPLPSPRSTDLPQKDWDVPVLWTNRGDMLKRRPDLAPTIQALRDDEVEALAALLAEALEEFYWIQLNVILSLSLDHELQLLKRVAIRS